MKRKFTMLAVALTMLLGGCTKIAEVTSLLPTKQTELVVEQPIMRTLGEINESNLLDIEKSLLFPTDVNDAITLTRLYELGPVLGVAGDEVYYSKHVVQIDDDGRVRHIAEISEVNHDVTERAKVASRSESYDLFPNSEASFVYAGLPRYYYRGEDYSVYETQLNMDYSAIILLHNTQNVMPVTWVIKRVGFWEDHFNLHYRDYMIQLNHIDTSENFNEEIVLVRKLGYPERSDLPEEDNVILPYDMINFLNNLYASKDSLMHIDEFGHEFAFIVNKHIVYGGKCSSVVNILEGYNITDESELTRKGKTIYLVNGDEEIELGIYSEHHPESLIGEDNIIPYNMLETLLATK